MTLNCDSKSISGSEISFPWLILITKVITNNIYATLFLRSRSLKWNLVIIVRREHFHTSPPANEERLLWKLNGYLEYSSVELNNLLGTVECGKNAIFLWYYLATNSIWRRNKHQYNLFLSRAMKLNRRRRWLSGIKPGCKMCR